ncbi:MAG: phospho-N-acetylmuramoyl-pentapeptide-transferase [Selenomonadales bacterium]|jgi:phospho-N-acetylmuramoyl-pentapeptide-transferase|nr:phospho-N-acetylmuramoyl-pentapeptide-transferase [Selenomonadales bacterium]MBQ2245992.1 phospho-N-acetylmuramoyl-pentapeptide-transferase [Selenomonadales bacterium]MBQ5587576.1 phospho-N-acetylmuramoyl-pentapeptide-transferase [Selenomonadales bacterium]MBR0325326.1 phospho-N-acetylmuramoyl-pentapeptide-transferase [Selenomonadales bacterium]
MIDIQQLISTLLVALAVSLALGPITLPMLRRLKFGQSIREEGPKSHQAKSGTPTMGGIMILIAVTVASLIFVGGSQEVWLALFIMLGHGVIGFIDDFIKVVLKRNLGLKARQKLLGQILMAVALVYISITYMGGDTNLWIPVLDQTIDCGIFYYILIFFVLVGTTNAVNLTDGLDGLASGTMAVAALAYTLICLIFGQYELAAFCMAVVGGVLGFLKYNAHPAKVFMGDTGSLALGGALAAVAVLTKTELLLIIVGGVFVVEALSVIIQVASFKTTGKRVFLMSPIHHHFELKGWSEKKVVTVFWLCGALLSVVALLMVMV